mmetsp:Transcript_55811/g.136715  ORF Transcript_55811/g.136715 Transcript_55811/m.136715 type:complete len:224 (+) Transcript_55811:529-1200(+)
MLSFSAFCCNDLMSSSDGVALASFRRALDVFLKRPSHSRNFSFFLSPTLKNSTDSPALTKYTSPNNLWRDSSSATSLAMVRVVCCSKPLAWFLPVPSSVCTLPLNDKPRHRRVPSILDASTASASDLTWPNNTSLPSTTPLCCSPRTLTNVWNCVSDTSSSCVLSELPSTSTVHTANSTAGGAFTINGLSSSLPVFKSTTSVPDLSASPPSLSNTRRFSSPTP